MSDDAATTVVTDKMAAKGSVAPADDVASSRDSNVAFYVRPSVLWSNVRGPVDFLPGLPEPYDAGTNPADGAYGYAETVNRTARLLAIVSVVLAIFYRSAWPIAILALVLVVAILIAAGLTAGGAKVLSGANVRNSDGPARLVATTPKAQANQDAWLSDLQTRRAAMDASRDGTTDTSHPVVDRPLSVSSADRVPAASSGAAATTRQEAAVTTRPRLPVTYFDQMVADAERRRIDRLPPFVVGMEQQAAADDLRYDPAQFIPNPSRHNHWLRTDARYTLPNAGPSRHVPVRVAEDMLAAASSLPVLPGGSASSSPHTSPLPSSSSLSSSTSPTEVGRPALAAASSTTRAEEDTTRRDAPADDYGTAVPNTAATGDASSSRVAHAPARSVEAIYARRDAADLDGTPHVTKIAPAADGHADLSSGATPLSRLDARTISDPTERMLHEMYQDVNERFHATMISERVPPAWINPAHPESRRREEQAAVERDSYRGLSWGQGP